MVHQVVDTTKLGHESAHLMERLAEEHEDAEIGEVMILAYVHVPPTADEDYGSGYIAWRCSDPREFIQRGLLHAALEQDRETEEEQDE